MSGYQKVVDVISKPRDQRTDFELQAILPYIRKKAHIFADKRTDLLKDIMRNCKFGVRQRDDIIIKQGEVGDCFYVVLSGQISIYILNQDGEEEEKEDLSDIVHYKEDGKLDRSKLGYFATTLGEGSPVGEVALIDETAVRTATIVADNKTDLLIIDRPLYNRCIKETLAKEFEEKTNFVTNNELFASWAPKYRKQLIMALYKETFPYESVMVRQGDNVRCIYFILSGQVEIQCDRAQHMFQYPAIFRWATENEADKLRKAGKKPKVPAEVLYTNIRKRDNLKSTRLCYLGMNESVGDTEMTMELDTYMQTAVCKEYTEVLVLEKQHYDRLFTKRHHRTIDAMREEIGVKMLTRKSLLSPKDDLPFLSHLAKLIDVKNKPPATTEKERIEPTVSEAEKEFLNHKGPLIDLHGPGSVFHLIRVREQTKLKLKLKRPQPNKNVAGGAMLSNQHVANGSHDTAETEQHEPSAKGRPKSDTPKPRSFRSIQSMDNSGRDGGQSAGECVFQQENNAVSDQQQPQPQPPPPPPPQEQQQEQQQQQPQPEEDSDSMELSDGWRSFGYQEPFTIDGTENAEQHDARLRFLEDKIRRWLAKDNPKVGPQVTQLRRLTAEDMRQQPHPGNKVVIRRRRRVTSASIMDGNSSRVRKEDARTQPFSILVSNSLNS